MENMTITLALRKISGIKGKIKDHMARAQNAVTWQERNLPAFKYADEIALADGLIAELTAFETQLRLTNSTTRVEHEGRQVTLSEATCILREYTGRIKWLKDLAQYVKAQHTVSEDEREYDMDTGKNVTKSKTYKCALPEAQRVAEVDRYQAMFDNLNNAVETKNNTTMILS